jgi:hypothetical protein
MASDNRSAGGESSELLEAFLEGDLGGAYEGNEDQKLIGSLLLIGMILLFPTTREACAIVPLEFIVKNCSLKLGRHQLLW